MKKEQAVAWLRGELPQWLKKGIVSEDTAAAIRGEYAEVGTGKKFDVALLVSAVIAAVCIGGGIIMLLAHNWSMLDRPTRAVIAFLPLMISGGLVWVTVMHGGISKAWRESTAIFWTMSVWAMLALIGQTYHAANDLGLFFAAASVLTLPVQYALGSGVVGIALSITAAIGSANFGWFGSEQLWQVGPYEISAGFAYALLAAAQIPAYISVMRMRERGLLEANYHWVAAISGYAAASYGILYHLGGDGEVFTLLQVLLLGAMYAGSSACAGREQRLRERPATVIGAVGLFIAVLCLGRCHGTHFYSYAIDNEFFPLVTLTLFGSAFAVSCIAALRRCGYERLPMLLVPVWTAATFALLSWSVIVPDRGAWTMVVSWSFDLLGAALAARQIVRGIAGSEGVSLNAGMWMLLLVLGVRFFDSDIEFTVKGIVFLVFGLGMLAGNRYIAQKKAGAI